ncbi:PorP/SprF family type IX secretion system membrane protein [Hufsiella ginkgonis]|uniref:Type IX secretion system membrane protein PorP/SprF n=1 Tax=Hufsiella ginkgonis TaxID=2695274 RepID=A0A7K1Y1D6_9SPHI|nr:PorP/SprF family type IX secretion system membrane protein [Hufsiella ginkgonis]MXV17053.1 type IX secretion system membrane protein PorP/SprF [Hufsiella ginkgonis]
MKKIVRTSAIMLLTAAAALSGQQAFAQLNPFGSAYFQNQYQLNPAMAGTVSGFTVNGGYRQQWSSIPGTPKTQSLTAEYGAAGKNAGFGLSLNNDKAGLQVRTRMMGTFAYHVPLSESNRLSFGVSLGYMDDRIENSGVRGDQGDQSIGRYNQRDKYVDGDFGIAFTGSKLSLQAAAPNLKNLLKKDNNELGVDRATFMAAASYKISFPSVLDGLLAEPKVCFRGVNGFDNILDAGANLNFANKRMNILGMYHSSHSATFGMGVTYSKLSFLGIYTTETAALRTYANGTFEIGVRLAGF